MAEPVLIAVAGLPGSGKSTVARFLAQAVGGTLLRTDEIRRQLFPQPTYAPEEGAQVYARLFALAGEKLGRGESVVLDATFQRASLRQQAQEIARIHAARWRFVLVTAPEPLIRDRISRRRGDASDADFGVYQSMQADFDPVEGACDAVHNDGDLAALEAQIRGLAGPSG